MSTCLNIQPGMLDVSNMCICAAPCCVAVMPIWRAASRQCQFATKRQVIRLSNEAVSVFICFYLPHTTCRSPMVSIFKAATWLPTMLPSRSWWTRADMLQHRLTWCEENLKWRVLVIPIRSTLVSRPLLWLWQGCGWSKSVEHENDHASSMCWHTQGKNVQDICNIVAENKSLFLYSILPS